MGEGVGGMSVERNWPRWRVALVGLLVATVLGLGASAPTFAAAEAEESVNPA